VIKKIFNEPLFHFLIIGTVLYFLYSYNNMDSQVNIVENKKTKSIYINENTIQKQINFLESYFDHNITKSFRNIIKEKLYEEKVLLEDAYSLELYKNNKEIEKILLKKIKYILHNEYPIKTISEEDIYLYYKNHIKDYSKRKNISFLHIHINPRDVKKLTPFLYSLLEHTSALKNFPKENNISLSQLKKEYGNYFVMQVKKIKKGVWTKAIPTIDGYEIIYITQYITTKAYSFESVQERVYEDYKREEKQKSYEKILHKLKEQYPYYKE